MTIAIYWTCNFDNQTWKYYAVFNDFESLSRVVKNREFLDIISKGAADRMREMSHAYNIEAVSFKIQMHISQPDVVFALLPFSHSR